MKLEIDVSNVEELIKKVPELREIAIDLSGKIRTREEEAVYQVLLAFFANSIPRIQKIVVEGDRIEVEPNNGIAYTANYYEYFRPTNDGYERATLWELIAEGYTIENPDKLEVETDGVKFYSTKGLTLRTNTNIDGWNILEKIKAKFSPDRAIVNVIEDGFYIEISSLTQDSYGSIVIDKRRASVVVTGGFGLGFELVGSALVPVIKHYGLPVKDIVASAISKNDISSVNGEDIVVI